MENVIAARRLRKSVLNSVGEVDLNLYNLNRTKLYKDKTVKSYSKQEEVKAINIKTKLFIKIFFCSLILFLIIFSKMFFLENIKSNDKIVRLYNHYKIDFTKSSILEKLEFRINRLDVVIGNIIPEEIKKYTQEKYFTSIKPYILTFDLKSTLTQIINLDNNNKKENMVESKKVEIIPVDNNNAIIEEPEEALNGIGGAEPLENKTEEVMSSISIMDIDIQSIKAKNISMVVPVSGVVTSRYGVRQEVFSGVDPYHTGIDIANKNQTVILSATSGVVTKVENNNKYYGNFIEITENGVIFKYAHLDIINVKQGSNVRQKDNIGLMGNTGMSTGTHLHFEIRINDRTVNPEELLKF